MNKRRWILLGFNLVLATTILAQPGAAATPGADPCFFECLTKWWECAVSGGWDCYWRLDECVKVRCPTIWLPI